MTITAAVPRAAAYRGRLRWWTELPLIAIIYGLYSAGRLLVAGDVDDAVAHGAEILNLEEFLHLDPEHWFNGLFTDHAFLGIPADYAYASLHYLVTPLVLVWLWRRRPTHYRVARTWLLISTLIGLVGFTVLPTAPPRLLPGGDAFMDTMAQYGSYGWWGQEASAPHGMGSLTNQYAAMPSLHVGWSLWCGIMLWRYGRKRVVRTLGLLYPLLTTFVVMGTANHYLMDAVAGATVIGAGFLLAKPALRLSDRVNAPARKALGLGLRGKSGRSTVVATSTAAAAPATSAASVEAAAPATSAAPVEAADGPPSGSGPGGKASDTPSGNGAVPAQRPASMPRIPGPAGAESRQNGTAERALPPGRHAGPDPMS